jgi:hypothetical protein
MLIPASISYVAGTRHAKSYYDAGSCNATAYLISRHGADSFNLVAASRQVVS